jgi:hypothetical protein
MSHGPRNMNRETREICEKGKSFRIETQRGTGSCRMGFGPPCGLFTSRTTEHTEKNGPWFIHPQISPIDADSKASKGNATAVGWGSPHRLLLPRRSHAFTWRHAAPGPRS